MQRFFADFAHIDAPETHGPDGSVGPFTLLTKLEIEPLGRSSMRCAPSASTLPEFGEPTPTRAPIAHHDLGDPGLFSDVLQQQRPCQNHVGS